MDKILSKKYNALSSWKITLIYCIVAFFLFFEMAIQVSPSVMSTQLMNDLNIGAFGLGLMSGIYFYSYTAMQIPSGILFDKYNPRIIITISILFCTLGTLLFAIAENIYVGSFARLLMGTGSAFAFVSVLVVTADLFKSKYFAIMTGITQMLGAFGAMAGQMPISALIDLIGWRNTLLFISLIGLALSIIVWKLLKYEKRSLHNQSTYRENIKFNLRKIISQPQTWYLALYSCLIWAPMSSFASLWGVPFLINAHHLEQTTAAFLCSLVWLGFGLMSPLIGLISTLTGKRVIILNVTALIGIISFAFILTFNFSVTALGILLFFAGAGCTGQLLCFTLAKENNPISIKGAAIAFNNMALVMSGALFQPLIGKIIEFGHESGTIIYNASNYMHGAFIILFAYIGSFLIALFLIKEPRSEIDLAVSINNPFAIT